MWLLFRIYGNIKHVRRRVICQISPPMAALLRFFALHGCDAFASGVCRTTGYLPPKEPMNMPGESKWNLHMGIKILKKMWFSINHHQYWNIKFPVAWLYANGQLSGVICTLEYHNYPQRLIGSVSFRQTCGCPSHILGRKPCWTSVSDMLLICGFQPCWTCSSLGVITTNLLEAHNSTLDTYTNHILIGYVRIFCGWYDYLQYWWLNSHQRVMSDDRQNWRHNVPHTHLHFPPVS